MTLLRLNGIPARWQSGMVYSDGDYDNLHDWGWLYLAPYGWVPMDVTTGAFEDDADPGIEWFYLGGLDAYRIAFNDDYGRDLVPAKQHFRSETVDLQRGEVGVEGRQPLLRPMGLQTSNGKCCRQAQRRTRRTQPELMSRGDGHEAAGTCVRPHFVSRWVLCLASMAPVAWRRASPAPWPVAPTPATQITVTNDPPA